VNAKQNKEAFQGSLDTAKQAIEVCGTDTETAHTKAGGIDAIATVVNSARTSHNDCRTTEATLKVDETTKCNDFDTYVANLVMPSCSCETASSLGSSGFKSCVEKVRTWSSNANSTWTAKSKLCTDATSVHSVKRSSCNTAQGTFESDFCSYEIALTSACSTQESCRSTQIALRDTAHASVKVSESAIKAEYESAKRVKCILDVLNATDDASKKNMLSTCVSATVETGHLDLTYDAVPDAASCSTTPVDTKPCEASWETAEFNGKSWLTNAPLETCVPCYQAPASAPTTASPAVAAAAAPAALVVTATTASGRAITVVPKAATNQDVFTDRNYKITSLGAFAGMDAFYIKPPNNDKDTAASSIMWTLQVNVPVKVYLDFWGGSPHVAKVSSHWLGDWHNTGMTGMTFPGYGNGPVYSRSFPAGSIPIYGNNGKGHGTFTVFVEQAPPASTATATNPAAGLVIVKDDTKAGKFPGSSRSSYLFNENDPSAANYMIIGNLNPDDYRHNGAFTFKVVYKQNDKKVEAKWSQTSWLTAGSATGFQLHSIESTDGYLTLQNNDRFTGMNKCGGPAVLCSKYGWWFNLGHDSLYAGGLPAWEGGGRRYEGYYTAELTIYANGP
jgi:hypothetical protein